MTGPAATRDRGGRAVIWLLVAAWAVLFCLRWIAFPDGDPEEAVNGNLAVDATRGLVAPLIYYQYQPWANGPLVFGALLTPFFWLFGSSMAWIKLLGGLFVLGGTIVWSVMIRRAWGAGAAALFLVWWIFPPPYLGRMMHVVWANHMETVFIGGMILLPLARRASTPPRAPGAIAHGLLAGLASFFCMQALAFAAAAAAAGLWRWKKAGRRWLALAAPAFAVGLAPKFAYRLATEQPTPDAFAGLSIPGRFAGLFGTAIPLAPGFDASWAQVATTAAFAAGVAWLVWRTVLRAGGRPPGESEAGLWFGRVLVLTLAFWLAAYALGPDYIHDPASSYWHRYLLPLFPIAMAAACFLLTDVRPRRLAWLALVPLIAMGASEARIAEIWKTATARLADGTAGWYLTSQRGDDYHRFINYNLPASWGGFRAGCWGYPAGVLERITGRPDPFVPDVAYPLGVVRRVVPEWRAAAYETLGRWIGFEGGLALIGDPALAPDVDRAAIAYGAGTAAIMELMLSPRSTPADADAIPAAALRLDAIDPALSAALLRGAGYELAHGFGSRVEVPDVAAYLLDGKRSPGRRRPEAKWERQLAKNHGIALRVVRGLPERLRPPLTVGAGRFAAFARQSAHATIRSWGRLTELGDPRALAAAFEQGYEEGLAEFLLNRYNHVSRVDHVQKRILRPGRQDAVARLLAQRHVRLVEVTDPEPGYALVPEREISADRPPSW